MTAFRRFAGRFLASDFVLYLLPFPFGALASASRLDSAVNYHRLICFVAVASLTTAIWTVAVKCSRSEMPRPAKAAAALLAFGIIYFQVMTLRKLGDGSFPLLHRGFHWSNESPYIP
jgi:hypothetical protein